MDRLIKILFLTFILSLAEVPLSFAQEKQEITERDYGNNGVNMADTMRSNGKIYIVVATIVSLFIGIVIYLVILDRKIGALEKNFPKETSNKSKGEFI